jgi:hypothetical protein
LLCDLARRSRSATTPKPLQEAIEKTDSSGKILPEMVRAFRLPPPLARALPRARHALVTPLPCRRLSSCTPKPTPTLQPQHHHPSIQILICQNLRNNLQHPNEYIRGVTLRFLCRIHEEEIIEPLVPSILANLEHR